ncbi:hypothetical protein DSO57_1003238 [Entomophthora muscae]|uniref:Uncharacterized protein n=1 Tax=Entomophthora muscae TaxID=34485 RepID=A0ACC2TVI8_9FUNG|nr:hypothetical protein DSO57_1003238 [Entomophthora muscae]
MKNTALMTICQVKDLMQTGTVKDLKRAYKELHLHAHSEMAFDNPITHLMCYNALKSHIMRHVNLDQVTNLQSLYCKAERVEQASNALHKVQTGKRESVTSDKLLLTMLTGKPQLQDLNPDTLRAGGLQIFGFEPEQDLTSGNPLRLDESKSPTSTLPMLKVPVNSTNQRAGLAIDPKITWATTEGETKKLSIERGPPRDD